MSATDLRYYGRPMNRDAITVAEGYCPVTFESFVQTLRSGTAEVVYLEPGDGTRYTLLLALVEEGDQPCLVVSRLNVGPEQYASLAFQLWDFDGFSAARAASHMACGNPWSEQVLAWWLRQVCEALEQEYAI